MFKKTILVLLIACFCIFLSGCARYGCPSNPQATDVEKVSKKKKKKRGKSSLFDTKTRKKMSVR